MGEGGRRSLTDEVFPRSRAAHRLRTMFAQNLAFPSKGAALATRARRRTALQWSRVARECVTDEVFLFVILD